MVVLDLSSNNNLCFKQLPTLFVSSSFLYANLKGVRLYKRDLESLIEVYLYNSKVFIDSDFQGVKPDRYKMLQMTNWDRVNKATYGLKYTANDKSAGLDDVETGWRVL